MKPITLALSPNTQKDDVIVALSQLFSVSSYQKGTAISKLEKWFEEYFDSGAVSFVNGRTTLYAILKSIGIESGDEVLMQSFTCIVVANSVIATGAKAVYVDVTSSLTIDMDQLEKKITKNTKAIIVQHTFGIATDMKKVLQIAKKHKVLVIEDVAHTIGGEYNGQKLGIIGDVGFFSFGRDKAFSSVFGGMVITKNKILFEKIKNFQQTLPFPPLPWIAQQLLHPILFAIILPLYDFFSLGKLLLVLSQKLHALSFPVSSNEKQGVFREQDCYKMPNTLCALGLHQVQKIAIYNQTRVAIARQYTQLCDRLKISYIQTDNPVLRFPIFVSDPVGTKKYFRKFGIYLGDWYSNGIDPKKSNFKNIGYNPDDFPQTKMLSKSVVNLPTYPTMTNQQIEKVLKVLEKYFETYGRN